MAHIGTPSPRIDARAKVTGTAHYGADSPLADPAYAFLAVSPIARGRISDIDDRAARAVRGVIEILSYRNIGTKIKPGKFFNDGGYVGTSIAPLKSEKIWHAGQIVAVVLAETFEAAREGAHRLVVTYEPEQPTSTFDSPGTETELARTVSARHKEDPAVGDAAAAFDAADVKVDAHYSTPTQHHNPMELFATSCAWDGDRLTVWDASQNVSGYISTGWRNSSASTPRTSGLFRTMSAARSDRAAAPSAA